MMLNHTCLAFMVALLAAGCAKHPPATHELGCRPLAELLTTDSGAVSISCSSIRSDGVHLECTIRTRDGSRPSKTGDYILSGSQQIDFDLAGDRPYLGWDGCYTIYLRDGRQLEEIETIIDGAT